LASATSCLSGLLAASFLCLAAATPRSEGAPAPDPARATAASRPEPSLPTRTQVARARTFATARSGLVSFAVIGTNRRLHCHRCWRPYEAASVIKAMLLVAYLARLAHERPITASDRALLGPMIRVSDNEAATAIYTRLGDAALYRLARRAGMKSFAVSGYWGSARITAGDQARFFAQLDRLTPPRYRRYALAARLDRLLAGLGPPRDRPADLAGLLQGRLAAKLARAPRPPSRPARARAVAIAVLTEGNPSHGYGRETVRGIAARLLRP
jgi:beta-lactamase class A